MRLFSKVGRLACVLVLAIAFAGCGGGGGSGSKSVILIIVDTLRADHVGCYGYERARTPYIDELAKRGTRFENVVTAAPVTAPSIATILTSTLPNYHGIRDNELFSLGADIPTLASAFRDAGYSTAGFAASIVLHRRHGFASGFDHYDDDVSAKYICYDPGYAPQLDELQGTQRRADAVTKAAVDWLKDTAGDGPFLCVVHYFDPHDPYDPPPWAGAGLDHSPYDGEIAYTDAQIGNLLQGIEGLGLSEETIVVFTSDHGEGLGEHMERTHGFFLYDSTVMVPLIFSVPGEGLPGTVISSQVRTLDIMPTMLDLAGLPAPGIAQGRSLARAVLEGAEPGDEDAYIETQHTLYSYNWQALTGLRTPRWKYVRAPQAELYDLDSDPGENTNLAAEERGVLGEMETRLRRIESESGMAPGGQHATRTERDQSVIDKMRALGYLGGGRSRDAGPEPGGDLPDPKVEIEKLNARQEAGGFLRHAAELLMRNEFDEALENVARAERIAPDYGEVWATKGLILVRRGDLDEGIALMERAIERDPRAQMAHQTLNNLGLAYLQSGDCLKAIDSLERSLEVKAGYHNAMYNLGLAHEACGNGGEAIRAYERFLAASPGLGAEQERSLRTRLERLRRDHN
jgi:arylsulfatase A-like enzyme/Tfp pilus assembly protein PilF